MAFNDLFCLSHPEVHTLSIGAAKPGDFDAHLEAIAQLGDAQSLVSGTLARLNAAVDLVHGKEWRSGWQEGIPEWTAIPDGVNVWEILRLWTCATALDMTAFAKMRYNLLGQGGHWFPGKNAAELDETAIRSVLTASPFRDRIPSILREAHELLFEAPVERLGKD